MIYNLDGIIDFIRRTNFENYTLGGVSFKDKDVLIITMEDMFKDLLINFDITLKKEDLRTTRHINPIDPSDIISFNNSDER
jgi:hypothetical protein